MPTLTLSERGASADANVPEMRSKVPGQSLCESLREVGEGAPSRVEEKLKKLRQGLEEFDISH